RETEPGGLCVAPPGTFGARETGLTRFKVRSSRFKGFAAERPNVVSLNLELGNLEPCPLPGGDRPISHCVATRPEHKMPTGRSTGPATRDGFARERRIERHGEPMGMELSLANNEVVENADETDISRAFADGSDFGSYAILAPSDDEFLQVAEAQWATRETE